MYLHVFEAASTRDDH